MSYGAMRGGDVEPWSRAVANKNRLAMSYGCHEGFSFTSRVATGTTVAMSSSPDSSTSMRPLHPEELLISFFRSTIRRRRLALAP